MEEIQDRLMQLINKLGLSKNQFANEIGTSSAMISKITKNKVNFGIDIIERIISKYPNLNSEWLLTGIGEIWQKNQTQNLHLNTYQLVDFDDLDEIEAAPSSKARKGGTPNKRFIEITRVFGMTANRAASFLNLSMPEFMSIYKTPSLTPELVKIAENRFELNRGWLENGKGFPFQSNDRNSKYEAIKRNGLGSDVISIDGGNKLADAKQITQDFIKKLYESPNWTASQTLKLELYDRLKSTELNSINAFKDFRDLTAKMLKFINSIDTIFDEHIETKLFEQLNNGKTQLEIMNELEEDFKKINKIEPILNNLNECFKGCLGQLKDFDKHDELLSNGEELYYKHLIAQEYEVVARLRDKIKVYKKYII